LNIHQISSDQEIRPWASELDNRAGRRQEMDVSARVTNEATDEYIADVRNGLAAANNPAAISVPEICAVNFALTYMRPAVARIAELGTFTGHTANILADLSPAHTVIEIYDFFEHNAASRRNLVDHPAFDPKDFYAVWKHNTQRHAVKFAEYRGDLNETKNAVDDPLDMLFVDIVKHASLVNTIVDPFYDRLRIGGFLLHQDYYHWQSPWLVYQMELLDRPFALVGDFGNNMSVYIKQRELTTEELEFDYVGGLDFEEKYRLFDIAIARQPGLRAGNLMASKLRLTLEDPDFDSETLQRQILRDFSDNERISGYAVQVMKAADGISSIMW
jgi:predicted O-methyltransferase YrrM